MTEIDILKNKVKVLENLVFKFIKKDAYIFDKKVRFLSGVNMEMGKGSNDFAGTRIGTSSDQLIGFWNKIAVVQPGPISSPVGGGTVDTQARNAIDEIILAMTTIGILKE